MHIQEGKIHFHYTVFCSFFWPNSQCVSFQKFSTIFEFSKFKFQIDKLRTQAEDQEKNLLEQEEEVHGKQRELDALKEEEKQLLEDIKASEKEILKFEHDLQVATEINSEVLKIYTVNR